ncbi:hypothetical protein WMY93_027471 [Mugilogobius chulae]|uniref:C2H2-type domain-containing protein n=1 Tax=Mugilogobius chulae TaxID=88201 RepID=A0AAW0MT27_9GOBI
MRSHRGDKPYSCSICEKTFTRKSTLAVHIKAHAGVKPYCCSICEKGFVKKSSLTVHMRTHTGEKRYSCSTCEKGFSHSSCLKYHERTHTGEKPYSCPVFYLELSPQKSHEVSLGEKPFSCSVCDTHFISGSNLKRHMRSHTEEERAAQKEPVRVTSGSRFAENAREIIKQHVQS